MFNGGGRSCEAAVLGVQALPDAFSESLSLEIMRAPCELTVVHTLRPHERASEIMTMQRQAKVAGDMSIGDGLGQREQIEMANAIVQGTHPSGLSSNVWTYNLTVVVYAESKAKLKAALLPVERALTLAGATATREGLAAEAAWWSVLPTFPEIHRRWRFLTFPIAALCVPQTTTAGIGRHDWADHEIARFRSTEGGIYRFTFHCTDKDEELGHMFVVAPAGAGKTSFMCHLTSHVLSMSNTRCVLFDRDCGTEVFTAGAGGSYVRFEAMETDNAENTLEGRRSDRAGQPVPPREQRGEPRVPHPVDPHADVEHAERGRPGVDRASGEHCLRLPPGEHALVARCVPLRVPRRLDGPARARALDGQRPDGTHLQRRLGLQRRQRTPRRLRLHPRIRPQGTRLCAGELPHPPDLVALARKRNTRRWSTSTRPSPC